MLMPHQGGRNLGPEISDNSKMQPKYPIGNVAVDQVFKTKICIG